MDNDIQEAINTLTREFIENARKQGVEIQNIEVDWIDGKYDARVRSSPHKPRVPAIDDISGVG